MTPLYTVERFGKYHKTLTPGLGLAGRVWCSREPAWVESLPQADSCPWDRLVAAFALYNLITIFATVATMVATGFVVAKWIRLFPIETAIINACRCSQGGTGDVAILTASGRMQLMPFAQIATRIGGLITVALALVGIRLMG